MKDTSLSSINDAHCFVQNSGIFDWDWAGDASAEGFADYLYANYSEIDSESFDDELRAYLLSVGEDPSDYIQSANRIDNEGKNGNE